MTSGFDHLPGDPRQHRDRDALLCARLQQVAHTLANAGVISPDVADEAIRHIDRHYLLNHVVHDPEQYRAMMKDGSFQKHLDASAGYTRENESTTGAEERQRSALAKLVEVAANYDLSQGQISAKAYLDFRSAISPEVAAQVTRGPRINAGNDTDGPVSLD